MGGAAGIRPWPRAGKRIGFVVWCRNVKDARELAWRRLRPGSLAIAEESAAAGIGAAPVLPPAMPARPMPR